MKIDIKRAQGNDIGEKNSTKWQRLWKVGADTIIEFKNNVGGKWPLVDDGNFIDLKHITLKVEANHHPLGSRDDGGCQSRLGKRDYAQSDV